MTRRPAKITSLIELKPQTIGLICRFHAQPDVRREVAENSVARRERNVYTVAKSWQRVCEELALRLRKMLPSRTVHV